MVRRGWVAVTVVALLVLPGCSGGGDAEGDGETRTVTTERGDVQIPEDPVRVAAIDWQIVPAMVDLGVTPVAIYEGYYEQDAAEQRGLPQEYVDAVADVERVGTWDSLSIEAVLETEPDLILTTGVGLDDEQLSKLEDIAPLVHFSFDGGFIEMQGVLAGLLNKTDEFDGLKDDFDAKVSTIQEAHAPVLDSSTWVAVSGGPESNYFIEGGATPVGTMLTTLGVTFAESVDPEGYWSDGLSYEAISDLDDASVVLYGANPDGTPNAMTSPLVTHPLFQALPAAQAANTFPSNDVAFVSSVVWATGALDALEEILGQVTL